MFHGYLFFFGKTANATLRSAQAQVHTSLRFAFANSLWLTRAESWVDATGVACTDAVLRHGWLQEGVFYASSAQFCGILWCHPCHGIRLGENGQNSLLRVRNGMVGKCMVFCTEVVRPIMDTVTIVTIFTMVMSPCALGPGD